MSWRGVPFVAKALREATYLRPWLGCQYAGGNTRFDVGVEVDTSDNQRTFCRALHLMPSNWSGEPDVRLINKPATYNAVYWDCMVSSNAASCTYWRILRTGVVWLLRGRGSSGEMTFPDKSFYWARQWAHEGVTYAPFNLRRSEDVMRHVIYCFEYIFHIQPQWSLCLPPGALLACAPVCSIVLLVALFLVVAGFSTGGYSSCVRDCGLCIFTLAAPALDWRHHLPHVPVTKHERSSMHTTRTGSREAEECAMSAPQALSTPSTA